MEVNLGLAEYSYMKTRYLPKCSENTFIEKHEWCNYDRLIEKYCIRELAR